MKKEVWIINSERIELDDVIETYKPTDSDRKEILLGEEIQERYEC